MKERDMIHDRPPMTSDDRRGWAAIDPTQHTYLVLVAYYDRPPQTSAVSHAYVKTVKFLAENLRNRKTLARVTQRTMSSLPRDPRWEHQDLGRIEIAGFDAGKTGELDRLQNLPVDTGEWAAYSEIHGAKVPGTQIGWSFHFRRAGKSGTLEVPWDDRAILVINSKLIKRPEWKPDRLRGLIELFFETWSESAPPYFGHAHIESEDDTKGGLYYTSHVILEYPEHRQFNHRLWWEFTDDRPARARGVYWGNYWGSRLVAKVGRKALDEFLAYKVYKGEPQTRFVTEDRHGGVFIGMSTDPAEIKPLDQINGFPPNCRNRMAILHQILRRADAII